MSRIEQALEKAARIREAGAVSAHRVQRRSSQGVYDPAVFEVSRGGVNKAAVDPRIVTVTDPYAHAAEEYKKLRALLFKLTAKKALNTIMVTSAVAGEGKSVTAINLAVSIAQELDHTVLLIDADLRKPSIHTYLGLKPTPGLSDYLESRVELSDILMKTGLGKLVFMPAGAPPRNPAELLASTRMKDLVREVKERYHDRYVIFDSSPVLLAADTLSLCESMDGIVYVVHAASTSRKNVTQALALIRGYNILGTVFNDVPRYLTQDIYTAYSGYRVAGSPDEAIKAESGTGE
jgi:protein-tyrosine kinase